MARSKKKAPATFGGIAFFLSLLALWGMGIYIFMMLPNLWDLSAFERTRWFAMGFVLGLWVGGYLFRGHISVLVHEWKHAILATLIGNQWKKMKVGRDSGHFEYSYSKETAQYNAFIALAPYWFPFFLLPLLLIGLTVARNIPVLPPLLIGLGFGTDLVMNLRDISPIQTDLTSIRGGFKVACLYIAAVNLVITGLLLACLFKGLLALQYLFYGLWSFVIHLVAYYFRS